MDVSVIEVMVELVREDCGYIAKTGSEALHKLTSSTMPCILVSLCVQRQSRERLEFVGQEFAICRRQ